MDSKMAIIVIVAAVVICAACFVMMGGGDKDTDDSIVGKGFDVLDTCEGDTETINFKISDYKSGVYTASLTDDGQTKTMTLEESKITFDKSAFGSAQGSEKVTVDGKQYDSTKYSKGISTVWVGSDGTVYKLSATVEVFGMQVTETLTITGSFPVSEKLYYVYYAFMEHMLDTPEALTASIVMQYNGNDFKFSLEPDSDIGGMQMYTSGPTGSGSEYFDNSEIANIKAEYLKNPTRTDTIDTFEGTKTVNVYEVAVHTYIYADTTTGTIYRASFTDDEGSMDYNTTSYSNMDDTANCMLAFAYATGRMG